MEIDDDGTDRAYHFNKNPRKIYISGGFPNKPNVPQMRYASQVTDQDDGLAFAKIEDEVLLRRTPTGRSEIRATLVEDDRKIKTLVIQKYDASSGPSEKYHFAFGEAEIARLLAFVEAIKTHPLDGGDKIHLTTDELGKIALDLPQAERLFGEHEELFLSVAENSSDLKRDLQALGYRRKTLHAFERMLSESNFFEAEKQRLGKTGEAVWQSFFEANTWIFGYGLCYQFLGKIDENKMEQYVVGHDLGSAGKRADAILKSQARINSLCFVEIKRHDTTLLNKDAYRADVWIPAKELVGGVAQVQTTVQLATERYGNQLELTNSDGEPTGEPLFVIEPRAFIVIGSLEEFVTDQGKINTKKLRAFELYRRNIRRPEIITFDELYNRAKFIVGDDENMAQAEDWDDNVPF